MAIEFRRAYDDASRFAELAADLVRRQVAVIVTPVGTATIKKWSGVVASAGLAAK